MKNHLIILLLFLAGLPRFGQAQSRKDFIINGSLTHMPVKPSIVYLKYDSWIGKSTDSALVKDGKYSFKGKLEAAIIATLSFDPKAVQDKLTIMLDEGLLNIASDQLLSKSKVTGPGAEANNEYLKVTGFTANESAAIKKIMESEAYQTDEALKKEVRTRSNNLMGNGLTALIMYVRQHPESPATPYFTSALIGSRFITPAMADTLYRNFPARLKSSRLAMVIDSVMALQKKEAADALATRKVLDDMTPLGTQAKDFTQKDAAGNPVSLSGFKGKYVLIDFWASWCVPCRADNPNIVKAFNLYKGKGFTVLGVSLDGASQKDNWLAAIEKDGLQWKQVSELNGFKNVAAQLYGVQSIPQNFLIDPNGIIIGKNLRGEELNEKLASIFN